MQGKFIVIEGIDGAGTTTQAAKLYTSLSKFELPVHVTEEPSTGPIGSIIRQVLHGRLLSLGRSGLKPFSWNIMALLFAADRLDHIETEILPNLQDGINVISDRYVYSSLVYQAVTSGMEGSLEWIKALNKFAPIPDIVFFLNVSPEEAKRRRMLRKIGYELYEDEQLQVKIAEKYMEILKEPLSGEQIFIVDGNKGIDEIAEIILNRTKNILGIKG